MWKLELFLTMKIEAANMLNNENRNCKYYFTAKVETTSMLICENRNCNYA